VIHNRRRRRRRRRVERFRDATTTNSCCLLPAGRVDRPRSDGAACSKSSVFQLADLTALRAYLRETHWSLGRVVRSAAADVAGRRRLRSASRGLLNFPRYNMPNYGRRAFRFAGPYVWNSLPEHIRQSTSIAVCKRSLKIFLLQQISHLAH